MPDHETCPKCKGDNFARSLSTNGYLIFLRCLTCNAFYTKKANSAKAKLRLYPMPDLT